MHEWTNRYTDREDGWMNGHTEILVVIICAAQVQYV